jgi:hypothetical protein
VATNAPTIPRWLIIPWDDEFCYHTCDKADEDNPQNAYFSLLLLSPLLNLGFSSRFHGIGWNEEAASLFSERTA